MSESEEIDRLKTEVEFWKGVANGRENANEERKYWQKVATYFANVLAATASHQLILKSVGIGEKRRQFDIAEAAMKALKQEHCPRAMDTQDVIKHLERIVKDHSEVRAPSTRTTG